MLCGACLPHTPLDIQQLYIIKQFQMVEKVDLGHNLANFDFADVSFQFGCVLQRKPTDGTG